MIEALTPSQERLLEAHHAEWLAVGTCTERADRPTAERAITEMYELIGEAPPKFIWCDSPQQAAFLLPINGASLRASLRASLWASLRASFWASLRDSLGASLRASLRDSLWASLGASLRDSLWASLGASFWASFGGQHDAYLMSYYRFCALIGVNYSPADAERLQLWEDVIRSVGWWWPYEDTCVISERLTEIHMEPTGRNRVHRLHRADGPSVAFADGFNIYSWHGTHVPAWVIDDPTPERIADEPNVEIRRCGIESYGWDRFITQLAECASAEPDPGNPGQLLRLYDVPERLWGAPVRLLVCVNGTPERDGTRRTYGLTVPADIRSPVAAAAWTAGMEPNDYRQLQRRT